MKLKYLFFGVLVLIVMTSHDLFLKLDGYFLNPGQKSVIQLYNGTFDKSDAIVRRARMVDVSLIGLGKRTAVDSSQWVEKDTSITLLNITSGEPGTWLAGVALGGKEIKLSAEKFNDYLEHDGLYDMLEWRKKNNAMAKDAVEEYTKHAKTIFQVGDRLTDDYKTLLGYALEFLPTQNPYEMHPGHDMDFQLLWQGKPLANQLVYVGFKSHMHDDTLKGVKSHKHSHSQDKKEAHTHSHGKEHNHKHTHRHRHVSGENKTDTIIDEHTHDNNLQFRTDEKGMIKLPIKEKGIYYLRTIHLVNSTKQNFTHESNWATLTFEIGDGLDHIHGQSHEHAHDHEHGIPSYIFLLGSLALIGLLYFYFNKSK